MRSFETGACERVASVGARGLFWSHFLAECMGVVSAVMEQLFLHFLAAVQLLMCELVLDQCCRGFMWCKQLLAARTRRMPAVADQSYTFVVLLVDTIMGVRLRESEAWTNSTPMLLALRAVSDGGRQAIDECGPVNGHATATAHYFGPIGLYMRGRRFFERVVASHRRPLLKVVMEAARCSKVEARAAIFELGLPPRAGDFSDNDVLDFVHVRQRKSKTAAQQWLFVVFWGGALAVFQGVARLAC